MLEPKSAASAALSRRALFEGVSACSVTQLVPASTPPDELTGMCRSWLAMEAEARRLSREWQRIETYLFKHHRWPELTREEQQQFPQAAALEDLDRRQDVLRNRQAILLSRLSPLSAGDPHAVLMKLRVAAGLIWPDEHPEAHALLRSAIRDLRELV